MRLSLDERLASVRRHLDAAEAELKMLLRECDSKDRHSGFNDPYVRAVQETVCDYYQLPLEAMRSRIKTTEYVRPRMMAMLLCSELTSLTQSTIGRCFDRDHSTVINAQTMVPNWLSVDARLMDAYQAMKREAARRLLELDKEGLPQVESGSEKVTPDSQNSTASGRPLAPGVQENPSRAVPVLPQEERIPDPAARMRSGAQARAARSLPRRS